MMLIRVFIKAEIHERKHIDPRQFVFYGARPLVMPGCLCHARLSLSCPAVFVMPGCLCHARLSLSCPAVFVMPGTGITVHLPEFCDARPGHDTFTFFISAIDIENDLLFISENHFLLSSLQDCANDLLLSLQPQHGVQKMHQSFRMLFIGDKDFEGCIKARVEEGMLEEFCLDLGGGKAINFGLPNRCQSAKIPTKGKMELVAEILRNGADWEMITKLTGITPEVFERMKGLGK
jgi:hypothetical protein